VRFYLEEVSADRLHLYVSAVGADPADPFVALSHPPSLARELQQRAGRYNTVGWEEDTSALSAELLPDQAFFDDLMRTMVQREAMTLAALDDSPPPLLISVWTGTDRAAHMFWRLTDPTAPRYEAKLAGLLGDAIDRTYAQMDRTVGKVRALLPPEALLLVLSDHGFHSFSRGFHVNRWLVDKGYLTLKPGGRSLADADWSKTRAYALGTGQIYLNLQGREGQGTVGFGAERDALLSAIRSDLLALRDGVRQPLSAVQPGAVLYSGPASGSAPDLVLSFAPGYQASWASRLGGVPATLFEDNQRKWSGDHASSLASETEGVLFTTRGAVRPGASIQNVATTILQVFDREIPPGMDLDTLF
jgi:predicted AlkP superfamily phosphohydrolase/phosphomutase